MGSRSSLPPPGSQEEDGLVKYRGFCMPPLFSGQTLNPLPTTLLITQSRRYRRSISEGIRPPPPTTFREFNSDVIFYLLSFLLIKEKSTKVNIWSAVPLPCFLVAFSVLLKPKSELICITAPAQQPATVSRAAAPEGQCPEE